MINFLVEFIVEVVLGGIWEALRPPPAPGACMRCNKNQGTLSAPGSQELRVCPACVGAINRNFRAASWFFIALSGLFICMWVLVGIRILTADRPPDWGFLIVVPIIGAIVGLIGTTIGAMVKEPTESTLGVPGSRLRGHGRPTIG